ncbi:MAG TPA: integrase arm-type DNA-binding domain-containing protein, partial [Geobacteraceae bacterium]
MPKIKITKTAVDKLPNLEVRTDYFDSDLTGFGVRVSRTAKTYFVMARVGGDQKRVSLGRHPVLSADKARTEAMKTLAEMNEGVDPNKRKALERVRGITLQEVHDKYLVSRPQMKSHSIAVDKSLLKCHLSDWLKKPIQEISRDMIAHRHLKIAQNSGNNTANNAMRLFRRLYNFAAALSDGDIPQNPVQRLSDSRQW